MKVTIKNRLAVLIRMRGLRSASEFGRRMTEAGFAMSSSHASRFEKDDMPATDLRFVNAACNVLQCLPDDLYDITIDLAAGEELDPTLVFPRHAVLRYEQSQPRHATGGVDSAAPIAPVAPTPPTPPTPRVPGKAKPAGTKSKVADADTGPKVTLFPYGKT
jgi:DNA-binding Xre family transcriptional regulator